MRYKPATTHPILVLLAVALVSVLFVVACGDDEAPAASEGTWAVESAAVVAAAAQASKAAETAAMAAEEAAAQAAELSAAAQAAGIEGSEAVQAAQAAAAQAAAAAEAAAAQAAELIAASQAALAAQAAAAEAAAASTKKEAITLLEQDWTGQVVTINLAKVLLEQEMGYDVEFNFATADSAAMFMGLASGQTLWTCCVWPPFTVDHMKEFIEEEGLVEDMGPLGTIGGTYWYVPTYMIEGDPERGIEATAPDIADWNNLNKYADLLSTADTGDKGRLIAGCPCWTGEHQEERIAGLGLNYEVVYAGSEAAMLAEESAAYERGEPFLGWMWEPHWIHSKLNLTRVNFPSFSADCEGSGRYDCGWQESIITKLAWPGLKDKLPEVYQFLQNFSLTNAQQVELITAVDDEGKEPSVAAQEWADANESVWKAWIP